MRSCNKACYPCFQRDPSLSLTAAHPDTKVSLLRRLISVVRCLSDSLCKLWGCLSDGARCLKLGYMYTKQRTYRRPFASAVRASLAGNPGALHSPQNEFGIGGDAISRCLEGLTCTLESLLSRSAITFSIPPHPNLTIAMQIWTNYETHISKGAGYVPQAPWGSASGFSIHRCTRLKNYRVSKQRDHRAVRWTRTGTVRSAAVRTTELHVIQLLLVVLRLAPNSFSRYFNTTKLRRHFNITATDETY